MGTRKGLDYLDEDGTRLVAMGPTQENPEENKFKWNFTVMQHDKISKSRLQSREAFNNNGDKAKFYMERSWRVTFKSFTPVDKSKFFGGIQATICRRKIQVQQDERSLNLF